MNIQSDQLEDFISRIKFIKPLSDKVDELEALKRKWEDENDQYSGLTSFIRHQYTNYDELCMMISVRWVDPECHNPFDGLDDIEDEEIYSFLKFRTDILIRRKLNEIYDFGIDEFPPIR